jgi:hypothetical protein
VYFYLGLIYIVLLVSLGTLTFRKGHRALFWFGFIFPVLWFAGAVMRPVPGAAR